MIEGRNANGLASLLATDFYRHFGKRMLDLALVFSTSLIVAPIVLMMAALVWCDGHNPFYSQMRIGKDGRHFRMWKIRTMCHDADSRLQTYLNMNPEAKAEWDLHQKLKRDPRITFIGKALRKTSLDELPQLWNVFEGSMSLVGPRPMMVEQQSDYKGDAYYRLHPGVTGLWQISDRNDCSFAGRAKFDDAYDESMSLKTDLQTLWRTVAVVLRGTGY